MSADFRLTPLKATKRNNLATFLKAPLDMGRVVHSRVEDARRNNEFELPFAASEYAVEEAISNKDLRQLFDEKLRSVPLRHNSAFLTPTNDTERSLVPLNKCLIQLNFPLNRPVTDVFGLGPIRWPASNDNWSPLDAA